ncbi:RNA-directed DNA polymerase from mobile element jockey [Eumeta japonica]|uniref:RNA-directed DNA polymerase from mobile element jockey n=1 Tax=Eumeta variegata TaxID=151549 RepID=A0A4C1UCY7_EUMVA|nr:RNA-directed DNA polymerase from mobile element jockey [Eumeta japonica]
MDWENFQTSLEALHLGSSFETAADAKASANLLVDRIKEAQARTTTLLPASKFRCGDLHPSIERRLRHKRRLHKLWTRTRCSKLKKELNDLSRNILEAVRDFRGTTWEATIDRAGESARSVNQLYCQLAKIEAPNCPITDRSGVCRYDAKARAEVIAEHLAEQLISNPPTTSPNLQEHYAQVENRVDKFMDIAPPSSRRPIYNPSRAIQNSDAGKIITIPKAGKDPQKLENIRPITLLFHVVKTFERDLLTKLRLFLTPRQEHYGFHIGHSTTLQLIRVLQHLAFERNCERYTVVILLEIKKAFDRVWHEGLIHKLLDTSLPPALTRVVASFLQCCSFCIAVDDVLSAPCPIPVEEDDIMLALYTDDSAYFASSRRADLAAKRI